MAAQWMDWLWLEDLFITCTALVPRLVELLAADAGEAGRRSVSCGQWDAAHSWLEDLFITCSDLFPVLYIAVVLRLFGDRQGDLRACRGAPVIG